MWISVTFLIMRVFEKKAIYCIIAAIFSIILAVHF